jgi:type I restriction enzyme S subunit
MGIAVRLVVSDWKEYKLGEVCSLITDGKHGDCQNETNSGYFYLSAKDVRDGKLIYDNARQIAKSDFEETHRRTDLAPGDILITNSGTIGRMAIATDISETRRTTFQKSVAILKPKKESVTSTFLYYLLLYNFRGLVELAGGTTQQNLLLGDLREFEITIPDFEDQKSIASILSSLDDKIDLLHRQNKTLEALAEMLFKQWFVEEAEEEWEEKGLDEIDGFLNGLACQKYPPFAGKESLPVIKIKELRLGITETTDMATAEVPEQYIVNNGDILFSWSGSLEVVIWSHGKGVLNQHLFKVSSDHYPEWFFYFWIKHYLPEFRNIAQDKATTMGHIQRHHLSNALVVIPSHDKMKCFDTEIKPMFEKIKRNQIQIRTLTRLRDTLLPKLMSGEVRVRL